METEYKKECQIEQVNIKDLHLCGCCCKPGFDPENECVITCYDWDGTVLGTTTTYTSIGNAELMTAVEAFAKTKYSGTYTVDTATSESRYVDDEAYPLTYKKGYNFAGWIAAESAEAIDGTHSSFEDVEKLKETIVDFETTELKPVNGMLYFKAAYIGNEELDKFDGSGGTEHGTRRYYTFSDFSYRIQTTSNIVSRFKIRRNNLDNFGVTRLQDPVLRVQISIGEEKYYMKININGLDEQFVELLTPANARNYQFAVVDCAENESFVLANVCSQTVDMFSAEEGSWPDSGKGYVFEAYSLYISDMADKVIAAYLESGIYPVWNQINIDTFALMGLMDIVMAQDSTLATSEAHKSHTAKNKILLYKAATNFSTFTPQNIIDIIGIQTGAHLPYETNYTNMKPKIEAVQAKRTELGRDLTIDELQSFIQNDFQ